MTIRITGLATFSPKVSTRENYPQAGSGTEESIYSACFRPEQTALKQICFAYPFPS